MINQAGREPVRLLLLYFSGTGNTEYVARYVAERLARPNLAVERRALERQPAGELPGFDLLVLGFPVYGRDAPPLVRNYLDGLALGEGRGAFVFCTMGGNAGGAVPNALRRLVARGYTPLGGEAVVMPGTDGLAMVGKASWMARQARQKDYDHLPQADRLVEAIASAAADVAAGRPLQAVSLPEKPSLLSELRARLLRVMVRWACARLAADEKCVGCGRCARACPVGAIRMEEGRPRFGEGCQLCLRCLHGCPQEAVQMTRLTRGKLRWHGPKGDFRI